MSAAATSPASSSSLSLADRCAGALWGAFIGDALAMPVHWYYRPNDIVRHFGVDGITGYEEPRRRDHPSSIMNLSSVKGEGRSTRPTSKTRTIIGDVIMKGRRQFWGSHPRMHYHQSLAAGDNTLNAVCLRLLLRDTVLRGGYDVDSYLKSYVTFMTQEERVNDASSSKNVDDDADFAAVLPNNDTYAESYHREFFANVVAGKKPRDAAGAEGHDTASMGGLVSIPAMVMLSLSSSADKTSSSETLSMDATLPISHLHLSHRSRKLDAHTQLLMSLFVDVLNGADLHTAVQRVCVDGLGVDMAALVRQCDAQQLPDTHVVGPRFSSACYIDGSLPALLFLAMRHGCHRDGDDVDGGVGPVERALLANANVGGENCHRGAVLGAVVGAAHGVKSVPARLRNGLTAQTALEREIAAFVGVVVDRVGGSAKL